MKLVTTRSHMPFVACHIALGLIVLALAWARVLNAL
jgi:cytochrome b561